MSCKTLQGMYAEKLEKENKQLKNKIDKATEQIEIAQYNLGYNKNCIDKDLQDLIEILGDKKIK